MTSPRKFTDTLCHLCGSPRAVVNPAWLRAKRERAGVSLREMAKRLKISPPYLSDVELGRRNVLPYIVKAYEDGL